MDRIEETSSKKTFKVTIPLIYEVTIDTNDETKKALIDYMGLETVIRNTARRMFLLDTSPAEKDSQLMSKVIRKRVDDFWNKDAIKVKTND
jgi:hypothetical protein